MGSISLQIPQSGQPNSSEDPKIASDLSTIQTVINGNLDVTNVTAAVAQSAGVNRSGLTVKGSVSIPASQSTGSTTYTTLSTADQINGIVLPTNGLISIWYQATWQESVTAGARAAFFIGANQLNANTQGSPAAPVPQETNIGGTAATNTPLYSFQGGIASGAGGAAYPGDLTTGQVVGVGTNGGPCYVFAAAGTYNVSVQFRATSGTVTASARKLWVQAISFA